MNNKVETFLKSCLIKKINSIKDVLGRRYDIYLQIIAECHDITELKELCDVELCVNYCGYVSDIINVARNLGIDINKSRKDSLEDIIGYFHNEIDKANEKTENEHIETDDENSFNSMGEAEELEESDDNDAAMLAMSVNRIYKKTEYYKEDEYKFDDILDNEDGTEIEDLDDISDVIVDVEFDNEDEDVGDKVEYIKKHINDNDVTGGDFVDNDEYNYDDNFIDDDLVDDDDNLVDDDDNLVDDDDNLVDDDDNLVDDDDLVVDDDNLVDDEDNLVDDDDNFVDDDDLVDNDDNFVDDDDLVDNDDNLVDDDDLVDDDLVDDDLVDDDNFVDEDLDNDDELDNEEFVDDLEDAVVYEEKQFNPMDEIQKMRKIKEDNKDKSKINIIKKYSGNNVEDGVSNKEDKKDKCTDSKQNKSINIEADGDFNIFSSDGANKMISGIYKGTKKIEELANKIRKKIDYKTAANFDFDEDDGDDIL